MTIAISAANAMEFYTFRRHMGLVHKLSLENWQHYLWQSEGYRIILLETGIGLDRASGAFQALLRSYKIDCMINFGSAGMIDERLQVGDAFLVDDIVEIVHGESLKTDAPMTDAIYSFLKNQSCNYQRGRLLTSPDPIVKRAHRLHLARQFKAGAVDMEAFALAGVARQNAIPFASLKMISDHASAMSRIEFWKNLPYVDRNLGKLMYGFLEYLKAA